MRKLKKVLILFIVLGCVSSLNAQDVYTKKYGMGRDSATKWYKLLEVDLNGYGEYNSLNIKVEFNYVNTGVKYNSSAFIRLREHSTESFSDWQNHVTGINQPVLKLKKTDSKVYELWGYSNGNYGHISFTATVTKEAPMIINIPELPFHVVDVNLGEDVLTRGDWHYSSGNFTIDNGNLVVLGKLEAKEVKVTLTPTADFVFENNYNLPTLKFIENFLKEKKHLPEIASAKEMKENGVNVGDFQIQLLQKIEELTLYTIEQQKEIERLKLKDEKMLELQYRLEQLELKNK